MTFQSFPIGTNSVEEVDSDRKHDLGRCIRGAYGDSRDKHGEFVYIKAGAALTAGQFYEVPVIGGTDAYVVDTQLDTTLVAGLNAVGDSLLVCVPVSTLAVGEFGWAFIGCGEFSGSGVNDIVVGNSLYTTGTAGSVGDATSTHRLPGTIALSDPGSGPASFNFFAVDRLRAERTV